jgi:regulator of replication initiation timing
MTKTEARNKVSACIQTIVDGDQCGPLPLIRISMEDVLKYIENISEKVVEHKPNGGKLRSQVTKLTKENGAMKLRLQKADEIIKGVVEAGKAKNRYVSGGLLEKAREYFGQPSKNKENTKKGKK